MLSPVAFVALLAGVLPAILWLSFWLLEDRTHPEPKRYIFFTFLAGMLMVALALPIEKLAIAYTSGFKLLFLWALCEEVLKFAAAYVVALHSRQFDEPLDAIIYMVTVALGFSAAENALFLLSPLGQGNILQTIITGDLRFIGATLLHTLSSATVGIFLAISFYKQVSTRVLAVIGGVILAVVLHALFNFFILGAGGVATFWIFLIIWLGIIAVLLGVERVKKPVETYV